MSRNIRLRTRYESPTDSRGARILVKCQGHQLSVPYDYTDSRTGLHQAAAEQLATKLGLRVETIRMTPIDLPSWDFVFEVWPQR